MSRDLPWSRGLLAMLDVQTTIPAANNCHELVGVLSQCFIKVKELSLSEQRE